MRKLIILCFAIFIVIVCFGYLFAVTFGAIPETGKDHSKVILGFLLASGLSVIIGYFWGSSSGSAAKSEAMEKELAGLIPPKAEPPKPPVN